MKTVIAVLLVANVAAAVWLWQHPSGQGTNSPASQAVSAGQIGDTGMGAPLVLLEQQAVPPVRRDSPSATDVLKGGEPAPPVSGPVADPSGPGVVTQPLDTATPKPGALPDAGATAATAPPDGGAASAANTASEVALDRVSKVAAPVARVVPSSQVESADSPAAPDRRITPPQVCLTLTGFPDKGAAEAWLGQLRDQPGADGQVAATAQVRDDSTQVNRHWVYVPVSPEQGADSLTELLDRAGFTDRLLMRADDGSRVVSLGVFRSDKAAQQLSARLQDAGFDAHLVIRPQRVASYAIRLVARSPEQAELIGSQALPQGVRRQPAPLVECRADRAESIGQDAASG